MLPPLYDVLRTSTAVAAVVGDRIYPHGAAPQDVARPYITWQVVAGAPENSLSDLPDIDRFTLQINCWHQTSNGVLHLASAVRDAVELHGHVTGYPVNQREPETKLYWIAIQMDWFLSR